MFVGILKYLFKVKYELKYDKKSYCMEYYFEEKYNGTLEIEVYYVCYLGLFLFIIWF